MKILKMEVKIREGNRRAMRRYRSGSMLSLRLEFVSVHSLAGLSRKKKNLYYHLRAWQISPSYSSNI